MTTFNELLDEMNANQEPSESIRFMEKLRDKYAPTIEMTKPEQVKLLDYLEMSNLQEFMDMVAYDEDDLYIELSFEDIAQAWLHPETIKVVGE